MPKKRSKKRKGKTAPGKTKPAAGTIPGALQYLPLIGICFVGLLFMVTLLRHGYVHGDEGVAVMGGWRIALGQIPHKDFFHGLPPFSFLPSALFFKVLGAGFLAERILVFIYAITLIVVCERLLHCLTKNMAAKCVVVAFLVPYGVPYWQMPSHHWIVAIVQIAALISLFKAIESGRSVFLWGLLAGFLSAAGCFSMQDQGAYLVFALVLLFFPWVRDKDIRMKLFLGWAAGGLILGIAFAIYLLPHVSLGDLVYQWIVFTASRYQGLPGNVGGLKSLGLQQIGSPGWMAHLRSVPDYTIPQTLFSFLLPLLPILTVGALTVAALQKWRSRETLGLLAAGALAFFGGCLHRLSQTNLVWAAPILIVVCAWPIGRILEREQDPKKTIAQAAAITFVCLCLLFMVGRMRLIELQGTVPVSGRAGTLNVPKNSAQSSMQMVIDAVEEHVPADAPLLCTRYNPLICFWTQRPNPTRFDFLIYPELHTDEQVEEIIGSLRKHPDSHVLLFVPIDESNTFEKFVFSNYTMVWEAPWARLMAPQTREAANDESAVQDNSP